MRLQPPDLPVAKLLPMVISNQYSGSATAQKPFVITSQLIHSQEFSPELGANLLVL